MIALFAFARAWAGPLILAAAVLAVAGLAAFVINRAYDRGFTTAEAIGAAKLAKAEADAAAVRAEHAGRVRAAEAELRVIDAVSRRRVAEAEARNLVARKQLEEAIDANPEFVAVERPAAFRRLRDDEFNELAAAAERGASMPAASLPSVPGPDAGDGRNPAGIRVDRSGEPRPMADLHQPTQ